MTTKRTKQDVVSYANLQDRHIERDRETSKSPDCQHEKMEGSEKY